MLKLMQSKNLDHFLVNEAEMKLHWMGIDQNRQLKQHAVYIEEGRRVLLGGRNCFKSNVFTFNSLFLLLIRCSYLNFITILL